MGGGDGEGRLAKAIELTRIRFDPPLGFSFCRMTIACGSELGANCTGVLGPGLLGGWNRTDEGTCGTQLLPFQWVAAWKCPVLGMRVPASHEYI